MEFIADVVQLGRYDVPAPVLAAAGAPLIDLVGEQGAASVDTLMGPVPVDGWRVINGPFPPGPGEIVVLAAPWKGPPWDPSPSDGWMQVDFTRRDREWAACIHTGTPPLRPGRVHRRAGLTLDWVGAPIRVRAHNYPQVRVAIRNDNADTWHGDGRDSTVVLADITDADGQLLARPRDPFASMGVAIPWHPLPRTLAPGATVVTSIEQVLIDLEHFAPGTYQIVAVLADLQLRSQPAPLIAY